MFRTACIIRLFATLVGGWYQPVLAVCVGIDACIYSIVKRIQPCCETALANVDCENACAETTAELLAMLRIC